MKDYLDQHLKDVPYFRALLRAVEARFYEDIPLPSPTLDLGCGDGHFASLAFDRPLEVGVDPWWGPVQKAGRRAVYDLVTCAEGAHLPYPDRFFASAVSNSVLEHISNLEPVLAEMHRVLAPGASFIFCVPNQRFPEQLSIARALERLRLAPLAAGYRNFFNRISRHHHCDSPSVWKQRLRRAGFEVEDHWDYFSPAALRVLEWGHYFGLPSWVSKILTGRWILAPADWNLALTRRVVEPHYLQDPIHEQGAYTFYRARRS